MPVLRIGGDNTLGNTFGPLIQGLGSAWDPKTRAEAYELQQRIWLQQYTLWLEQRKAAAQEAATQTYAKAVSPEGMPVIHNMIISGASEADVAKAAARYSHSYIDELTPEADAFNRQRYENINGKTYEGSTPLAVGPVTEANARALENQQTLARAQAEAQGRQNVTGIDITTPHYFPGPINPTGAQPSASTPTTQASTAAPPVSPTVTTPGGTSNVVSFPVK